MPESLPQLSTNKSLVESRVDVSRYLEPRQFSYGLYRRLVAQAGLVAHAGEGTTVRGRHRTVVWQPGALRLCGAHEVAFSVALMKWLSAWRS